MVATVTESWEMPGKKWVSESENFKVDQGKIKCVIKKTLI